MTSLTSLQAAISEARKALESDNDQTAEQVVWEMCQVYERDFNVIDDKDYTPELALIQYQCLDILLDLHIRRGDTFDVAIRFAQLMNQFRKEYDHYKDWSKEDWKPIQDIIIGILKKYYQFNQKGIIGNYKPKQRNEDSMCELCRKNKADKTGSHMVPHMLIADIFSYDGSKDRDKVTVFVNSIGESKNDRYFGHQVYDDTINELLGHGLTDEELDSETAKTNALTVDHIFCTECEKRFGVIESWYAEILSGKEDYPPQVPYLFWLSVVWRMAVGDMGMVLDEHHQEKLRKVLDKCLALKREDVILQNSKLGHCAYSLYKADDTRDESLGVFGTYEITKPYQAMMGRYFINLYTSLSAAKSFIKAHDLPIEDLNDGMRKEKVGELNFIEFWSAKRQILDMAWKNGRSLWNIGRSQHKTLSKMEADMGGAAEPHEIPMWMNSENPGVVNIPRSIQKILDWIDKHKENRSLEQMSTDLGYSVDEIGAMIDYWNKVETKRKAKIEYGKKYLEDFNALVEMYGEI